MENLKSYIELFLTHYNGYLDICLGINEIDEHENEYCKIYEMKRKLNSNRINISLEEYTKQDSNIFYEYLTVIGVI